MDINSVTTGGFSISGGFTTDVGDTVTAGYAIASGDINISDADARKIARYVWNEKLENNYIARELMRLFASVLGSKVSGMDSLLPDFLSLDGTKTRVKYQTDEFGNRKTQIILDLD